jgi:hypothetical protein
LSSHAILPLAPELRASALFMKAGHMNRLEKVLYTAKAQTTGGRAGMSRSSDGRLEVRLSRPGNPGAGHQPGAALRGRLVDVLRLSDGVRCAT